MTVGVAETARIFYSAASGVGNSIVYVGSKDRPRRHPRRDHGERRFLRGFGGQAPDRPGRRPFTEKLLIEACLELMASDAIVAIQDMGAAGLTSSSVEMASKGGVGIELDMDAVPCREAGMTPYE
ncbi:MAG: AIR synthase-related protein [Sphingomonas sp.]